MQRLGPSALTAGELLAIFLRTGTQGASAIDIGKSLIQKHGSLSALGRLHIEDLRREHGLGLAKACQLAAAFELGLRASRENLKNVPLDTPSNIYEFFRPQLQYSNTEQLLVGTLTSKLHLRRVTQVSSGTATFTPALIRDVLRPALIEQAPAFVVVHNHPSGDPKPSQSDDTFTCDLAKAARLFNLTLADHIIIGHPSTDRDAYYSYLEHDNIH